jgi:hypothetical protein
MPLKLATDQKTAQDITAQLEGLSSGEVNQLDKALKEFARLRAEQARGRDQVRVDRLTAAYERLQDRIKRDPQNPKVERWKERCAEYQESARNWDTYGQETPPTGKPGVSVDVQLGRFDIKTR